MGIPVTLTDPQGNYVEVGGGGGGASSVTVTNFPTTQPVSGPLTNTELRASAVPVSGPLTNAQFTAVSGAASVAAWNGTDASATIVAILKAIHAQNAQMVALLSQIQENTISA